MGNLYDINPGNKPASAAERTRTHIYEDEIRLIDYLRILWKQKYFIILVSTLPALISGIAIYLLPNNFEITYTYDLNITDKDSKMLLDKFYSQENLDRIINQLKQNNLENYAEKISNADTIQSLRKLVSFEVLTSLSETNEVLKNTGIKNINQIWNHTNKLLTLTIIGNPLEEIPKISSIIRNNFENTIPMYSAKQELNNIIIGLKTEMANIEKNRFHLDLELKTKKSILIKLKSLKPEELTDTVDDVILQFDNVSQNSEYLPLAYQIQATDANIINIEETIKTNQEKYNYYDSTLKLNETIYEDIAKKGSLISTIRQFHSYLVSLVDKYSKNEQIDYLSSYIKRIENTISENRPIIEEPKIYTVPKGLIKKSSIVFAASLIISTIFAFILEVIHKKPIHN